MRMPSRFGVINRTEKQFLGCLAVPQHQGLIPRVSIVKTPRKPASATQLALFSDRLSLFTERIPKSKPRYVRSAETKALIYGPAYQERIAMEPQRIKRCNTCKVVKPYNEFYVLPPSSIRNGARCVGGVHNTCKDCQLARARASHMQRTYGITLEQYTSIYDAQDGKCAICGTPGKSRATEMTNHRKSGDSGVLAVDHDHATGEVRGLLCRGCNQGIGNLRESADLLRKAAAYLDEYRDSSRYFTK